MNITFHVLSGIGLAAAFAPRRLAVAIPLGLAAGILLHGVLDYVPHTYPIPSALDALLGAGLIAAALLGAKPDQRATAAACMLGCVLPDLVDLAPAVVNHRLGLSLPQVSLSPWHWKLYSGSVYDGSRTMESLAAHALVIAFVVLAKTRSTAPSGRGSA